MRDSRAVRPFITHMLKIVLLLFHLQCFHAIILFNKEMIPKFEETDMIELYHLRSFPLQSISSQAGTFKMLTSAIALRSSDTSAVVVLEFRPINDSACFLPLIVYDDNHRNGTLVWDKRSTVTVTRDLDPLVWQQSTFLARINGVVYMNYVKWVESYLKTTGKSFVPQSICSTADEMSCFTLPITGDTFIAASLAKFASLAVKMHAIIPPRASEVHLLSSSEPHLFTLLPPPQPPQLGGFEGGGRVTTTAGDEAAAAAAADEKEGSNEEVSRIILFSSKLRDAVAPVSRSLFQLVQHHDFLGYTASRKPATITAVAENDEKGWKSKRGSFSSLLSPPSTEDEERSPPLATAKSLRGGSSYTTATGAATPSTTTTTETINSGGSSGTDISDSATSNTNSNSNSDNNNSTAAAVGAAIPQEQQQQAMVAVNSSTWYEENQEKEDEDLVAMMISDEEMTMYYSQLIGCMASYQLEYFASALKSCLTGDHGYVHLEDSQYYHIRPRHPFALLHDYWMHIPPPAPVKAAKSDYADVFISSALLIATLAGLFAGIWRLKLGEWCWSKTKRMRKRRITADAPASGGYSHNASELPMYQTWGTMAKKTPSTDEQEHSGGLGTRSRDYEDGDAEGLGSGLSRSSRDADDGDLESSSLLRHGGAGGRKNTATNTSNASNINDGGASLCRGGGRVGRDIVTATTTTTTINGGREGGDDGLNISSCSTPERPIKQQQQKKKKGAIAAATTTTAAATAAAAGTTAADITNDFDTLLLDINGDVITAAASASVVSPLFMTTASRLDVDRNDSSTTSTPQQASAGTHQGSLLQMSSSSASSMHTARHNQQHAKDSNIHDLNLLDIEYTGDDDDISRDDAKKTHLSGGYDDGVLGNDDNKSNGSSSSSSISMLSMIHADPTVFERNNHRPPRSSNISGGGRNNNNSNSNKNSSSSIGNNNNSTNHNNGSYDDGADGAGADNSFLTDIELSPLHPYPTATTATGHITPIGSCSPIQPADTPDTAHQYDDDDEEHSCGGGGGGGGGGGRGSRYNSIINFEAAGTTTMMTASAGANNTTSSSSSASLLSSSSSLAIATGATTIMSLQGNIVSSRGSRKNGSAAAAAVATTGGGKGLPTTYKPISSYSE